MTPQLQQAKILQLPPPELEALVQNERGRDRRYRGNQIEVGFVGHACQG